MYNREQLEQARARALERLLDKAAIESASIKDLAIVVGIASDQLRKQDEWDHFVTVCEKRGLNPWVTLQGFIKEMEHLLPVQRPHVKGDEDDQQRD